jgi:protein-tyrosine phosphatase
MSGSSVQRGAEAQSGQPGSLRQAVHAAVCGEGPRRDLGLVGSPNFRDFGGYRAAHGSLRWGRLFRSGHLAALQPEDGERLAALGLQLVVDLRRHDECRHEPSQLPQGVPIHHANINPGSQANALFGEGGTIDSGEAMFAFMCDINRQFVQSQCVTFAAVFAALLDSGAERVLFHCSAGKDRTGFAVAMLRLALGVSREDVYADYLLSARYFDPLREVHRVRGKYRLDHLDDAQLMPLLSVETAFLDAAFETIDAQYDSTDAFLAQGLGLDAAARRELARRFID